VALNPTRLIVDAMILRMCVSTRGRLAGCDLLVHSAGQCFHPGQHMVVLATRIRVVDVELLPAGDAAK
jgi:hypothetical protein